MNYYFVAALVVSILTTVRTELKRTTFTSKSILIQSSFQWALGYFFRDLNNWCIKFFDYVLLLPGKKT
jgi:hypothetical protein